MNLSENTILIIGGSSGIGFEMAKELLKRNNKVIITGRNEQRLQKVRDELDGVVAIKSDISNSDDIKELYQQIEKDGGAAAPCREDGGGGHPGRRHRP